MGVLSRRKGAAWERAAAGMIQQATGVPCVRNLEECRDGNAGDLKTGLPLAVQCKVGARPDIYGAVRQAAEAAIPGQHPVAIVRRNGSGHRAPEDLAIMPLADFLEIIGQMKRLGVW